MSTHLSNLYKKYNDRQKEHDRSWNISYALYKKATDSDEKQEHQESYLYHQHQSNIYGNFILDLQSLFLAKGKAGVLGL